VIAVVGLGSNVGDRLEMLREATRRLRSFAASASSSAAWRVVTSRVHETAPVGGPPQGDFLNAAVLIEASVPDPRVWLAEIVRIETALGRTREIPWGPRTIDLDLLWMGDLVLDAADLVVPHPRLVERAFALAPLLDVAPTARDPRTGRRYADLPLDLGGVTILGDAL